MHTQQFVRNAWLAHIAFLVIGVWLLNIIYAMDNLTLEVSGALTLQTQGFPAEYGTPSPFGYGTVSLDAGTPVVNAVDGIVADGSATRRLCTGWTGTGSVYPSGTGAVVSATINTNSTVVWNWRTQYLLTVATNGAGSVSAADAWQDAGTNVLLTAEPADGWAFSGWAGDTGGCAVAGSAITLPMTGPRAVAALFTAEAPPGGADPRLVLWNRLGSDAEVRNSAVGTNGLECAGSFVPGVFGGALEVSSQGQLGAAFPAGNAFPSSAGCVEFWARLNGLPVSVATGSPVNLLGIQTEAGGTLYPMIHFNSNDGGGNGGLCGRIGTIGSAGTGAWGPWTYSSSLRGASVTNWHHYALVWAVDGVPGQTNPVRRLAVFVDGALNTGSWNGPVEPPSPLVLPDGARLGLALLTGLPGSPRAAVDNLKVWSYAKTDFSDRFEEAAGSQSCQLTVTGARGAGTPPDGTSSFTYGETVSATVISPLEDGDTRFVCTGATVTGNDCVPNGPTNVTLVITNDATLVWNWSTEYRMEAISAGNGSTSGSGWYPAETNVLLTATPDEGYQFAGWSDGEEASTRWIVVPEGGTNLTAGFAPLPHGCLRFSKPVYSVSENGLLVKLTVERVDGTYGAASVSYANADGTAVLDSDYSLELNTLSWTNGQAGAKSIYIDILDDDVYEGNESFTIRLTNVAGASLGEPDTATVTIVDNEGESSRIVRFSGDLGAGGELAFGDVPTNQVAVRTVDVWNDGNLPLSITNVLTPQGFCATPTNVTVAAGETASLTVHFAPTEIAAYSGLLTLCCNATTGTTSLAVSGTGVEPVPSPVARVIDGLSAMIVVTVPSDATVLGVEDELAPGLTPVTITDGGTWDPANRKVKWFFSEPGQVRARVLQYAVDGAGSVVAGWANFGTTNLAVTGDTVFTGGSGPGLLHPADANGDWRVALDEVSASVTRWRNGTDDVKTPIVIRGITLYLQGELYHYNPLVSAEAKRWEPLIEAPSGSAGFVSPLSIGLFTAPQEGAVRTVTSTNVTIAVTPVSDATAWGLEESVSEGVVVTAISDDGTWDNAHRTVKWAFFDGTARTLTYTLAGEAGTNVTVDGQVSFDGSEDAVTGTADVAVPLPFQTWLDRRGLAGEQATLFDTINSEHQQPNGLVYALQPNLRSDEPILSIGWLNGKPVVEFPKQDPSTLPYVDISVIGTTDLNGSAWSLDLTPAEDQSGVPSNRKRWEPLAMPDKAFFKLRVTPK